MTQPRIESKRDYLALAESLSFGNQFRSWATLGELRESGYRGYLTIRNRVKDSPYFVPVVAPGQLSRELVRLFNVGATERSIYFQEIPAPETQRTINAEVCRSHEYLWLTYGLHPTLNLRHDLEQNGRFVKGAEANSILQTRLDAECWGDLQAIWDTFPTSTVELTGWNQPVGVFNRKMTVWEVRDY